MTTTLERILPEYDQHEVHSRWIAADPATVWTALHEVEAADLRLTRLLMRVRYAGRTRLSGPVLDALPARVLASTDGAEIVSGLVARYWQPQPRPRRLVADPDAFIAFDEPGWVKVGMSFQLTPERGGTRLTTETRCQATDARARAKFWAYWAVIRAGSGLIRREILRAVALRAEGRTTATGVRPRQ